MPAVVARRVTADRHSGLLGQPPWVGALQLTAAWSVAVAQPLFQVLAPNATFFLYHRATFGDVVVVALALSLPVYLVFWALEWAAGRVGPRFALGCRAALLTSMAGLLWIQPLKRMAPLERGWVAPLAWGLALVSIAAYLRFGAVRRWLALLSAATPLFVALFLASPEIRGLAASARGTEAARASLPADGPSVVMIVLDGLPLATLLDRDAGIDRDLFPNFGRLADTAHWFRNASTVATTTNLALPAILTGNSATGLGAATLAKYPDNLFTLLDGSYPLEVDEQVSKLAPRTAAGTVEAARPAVVAPILADLVVLYRHLVTVDPVAANLPTVADNWGGFGQRGLRAPRPTTVEEVPEDFRGRQFERFIASIERREGAQLYFHHTLLTHKPSRYLPSGRQYEMLMPTAERLGMWWVDAESVAPRNYLLHVLQIQYADRLIGRLLDRLQGEGLLASSIVVVCADHGQTFWPGGGSRLELATVAHPDDILRVPLFIKEPGRTTGTVDDRNVDLRDVTPAVADLLGVDLPWATEGHSPFAADFPTRAGKRLVDEHGTEISFGGDFAPDPETQELQARYTAPQYRWRRLYRDGPLPELVGRRLEELETVPMDFSFTLDEAAELADLDPRSEIWPVRLSGTVDFPAAPPSAVLALAVNGRIETTLQLRFRKGRSLFSGFVAEEAIVGGRNTVDALLVDAASGMIGRGAPAGRVGSQIGGDPAAGRGSS